MDIREILRQLRAGESERAISRSMRIDRATVKRYRAWAQQNGLLAGDLPPVEALEGLLKDSLVAPSVPQNVSSVEPYRKLVEDLREQQVNIKTIWRRLTERGFSGSMHCAYRFVWQLEGRNKHLTTQVEREPGEEAQVDFGYAGYMLDEAGKARKAWAFVMTLSWSL